MRIAAKKCIFGGRDPGEGFLQRTARKIAHLRGFVFRVFFCLINCYCIK